MNNRITAVVFVLLLITPAFGAGAVAAQSEVRDADLAITQPHYVESSVGVQSANGTTVYSVSGPVHQIKPQNFDTGDVVDFGLIEAQGSLSLNQQMDTYRFESGGNNGTFRAFWIVEQERTVNETQGNETIISTETIRIRYEAVLSVEAINRIHIPPSRLEESESDAENWTRWEDTVRDIAGEDANIELQTFDVAAGLLTLRHNPFEALTGDFLGLLIALVLSLSGLFLLAVFASLHYISRRGDIKELHEIESLEAGEEEVVDRLNRMYEKERMVALENMDWQDIFPNDHTAQLLRESLGNNPFAGFLQHLEVIGNIKEDRLKVMAEAGYKAAVQRSGDGKTVESARILGPADQELIDDETEEVLQDGEAVEELDSPDTALINAIPWDDPLLVDFDMSEQDIDEEVISTSLTSPTLDELITELDVHIPRDFESKQKFAEYYLEFLETVREHDYTDSNGKPRELRHVANVMLRLSRFMGDKNDVPMADWSADWVEMLLYNSDQEREILDYVSRVREGKET